MGGASETSRIVAVDDEFEGIRRMIDAHTTLRSQRGLPPIVAQPISTALAQLRDLDADHWSASDLMILDCLDRNGLVAEPGAPRTTFYALDVLTAVRQRRDAGRAVPRVVVFSRAMGDAFVRATLAEFVDGRRRVRVDEAKGVVRGWRVDVGARAGELWAMYDRSEILDRLGALVGGDRTGSLLPPVASSSVWDEVQPGSCLASFHQELRSQYPDVWADRVIGDGARSVSSTARTGIRRLGLRYLEPHPVRGRPTYKGYLAIARRIADPLS